MKKLLLFFALATAATVITSCDPPEIGWAWIVENNTGQPLKFKFPYDQTYQTRTIMPEDNVLLYLHNTSTKKRDGLHFDDYFKTIIDEFEGNVYWQILSDDETTVTKTWNYSEKDQPEQRFFDESLWNYEIGGGGGFVIATHSWIFEILPEDIQTTN